MKKATDEKKIWDVIEKIVGTFYIHATRQAKLSDHQTFKFNITKYYLSYCNPDKTHELLKIDLPQEADCDISRGHFYISMSHKFMNDNVDKIITKLLHYFPDCNFKFEHREGLESFYGVRRRINYIIINMRWDNIVEPPPANIEEPSPDNIEEPPPYRFN